MTTYALVGPGDVIDRVQSNIDPTVATKTGWKWLPVEDTPAPSFVPGLEAATSERIVSNGKAVLRWAVARRPLDEQKAAVKAEAQRRIIVLTGKANLQDCMIKQFNALMRAGQITDKRVNGDSLTAEEELEAASLRALADRVKAIRAISDQIEALDPIPADYADDGRWA